MESFPFTIKGHNEGLIALVPLEISLMEACLVLHSAALPFVQTLPCTVRHTLITGSPKSEAFPSAQQHFKQEDKPFKTAPESP